MTLSATVLRQKAAGYVLAASNASKREINEKPTKKPTTKPAKKPTTKTTTKTTTTTTKTIIKS